MSLFPAYGETTKSESSADCESSFCERNVDLKIDDGSGGSDLDEDCLLSDGSSEGAPGGGGARGSSPGHALPPQPDYYVDTKLDRGNLRVSTLYYPGRPEYSVKRGAGGGGGGERARRYYEAEAPRGETDSTEAARRSDSYRLALAASPHDESLWLRYLDFLEKFLESGVALAAAETAESRCPGGVELRRRRLRIARRHLPADRYLALLEELLASERERGERGRLWLRLMGGVARSAGLCSAPAVLRVAAAALRDPLGPRYVDLLYVYGAFLRAAGLWERLVSLLELALAMNYPPPPGPPPEAPERGEHALVRLEDEALACGLPAWCVWTRVERARAAAHWRPARGPGGDPDPQREPRAADAADLLLPAVTPEDRFALAVHALRLAKVPPLPGHGWVPEALHGEAASETAEWDPCDGTALLPLLEAAVRVGGRCPEGARAALLALADPPHYYSDRHGYLSWSEWLWSACVSWFEGREREALLCWRVRWHALLLAVGGEGAAEEGRRVRRALRGALREAGRVPLAYAEYARVERAVSGAEGARRVALSALRAAPPDPVEDRLYMARIVWEVGGREGGEPALVRSVLGLTVPEEPIPPPSVALLRDAYAQCCRRCLALEGGEGGDVGGGPGAALLPGAGEWARARALLAPARDLHALYVSVRDAPEHASAGTWRRRYDEECCEGVVMSAHALDTGRAPHYARALLSRHPHNALLSYMSGRAPLWSGAGEGARRGQTAALGALLPALLEAAGGGECTRLARGARRATASCPEGAALWSLRLWAECRAPCGRPHPALYRALAHHPHHKWLHVRGAAAVPSDAHSLADLLLDKQLRLHALPLELEPVLTLT